jgi:hypothetical protein
MIRAGVLSICLVSGLLGGCLAGDDPNAGGGGGGGSGSDNNTLDRSCTAALTITGTFAPGQAAPLNPDGSTYEGCWPIGTWTFSAALVAGMDSCSTPPTPLPSYSFVATVTTDPQTGDPLQNFKYTTDSTAHAIVHVSEASNAQCEGEVDVYSADGTQIWNMKPWLATGTITGEGEFQQYNSNQWTM